MSLLAWRSRSPRVATGSPSEASGSDASEDFAHPSAEHTGLDQRVTAIAGVLTAILGAVVALYGRGTTFAVFTGLVTLCVTPGCAVSCWNQTRDRLARAMVTLAASLTWTILAATALALLRVTNLDVLIAATSGLGGVGSAAFLATGRLRPSPAPAADPDSEGPDTEGSDTEGSDTEASLPPQAHRVYPLITKPLRALSGPTQAPKVSRRITKAHIWLAAALVTAAGLLAISVLHASGQQAGHWGLLPLVGIPFLVAMTLTVVVLVLALRSIQDSWPLAVAALVLLLVECNGTAMMLDSTPMWNYSYKHFGVVDYIVQGKPLTDPLDIYQQWPGFFAAGAALVRLSGRAAMSYSNWAKLFFMLLSSAALFAIARRFAEGKRLVPYVTVVLFSTATWEGQFYYSPQTIAFLLALLLQFLLVPLLVGGRLRRPILRLSWLEPPALTVEGEDRITPARQGVRIAGIAALFLAIVVTHQLTPFMLLGGILCLWLLGVLRNSLVVSACAFLAFLYPVLHLPAVTQNSLLSGFSFFNAAGTQGLHSSTTFQMVDGLFAKSIGLGLWGITAVCVLSYRRRMGTVLVPVVLALVPLTFLLVSSYDGEGIYRAFLFSAPWCALIIAKRLADTERLTALRLALVGAWAIFAALGSAQSQDFGMYGVNVAPPSEIAAAGYFLQHAPASAQLVTAVNNFPSRLDWRYAEHNAAQTQNDMALTSNASYLGKGLGHTGMQSLAQYVSGLTSGNGYLVIAPSIIADSDYYNYFTPGTLPSLVQRMQASKYWKPWYEKDGTYIFQALPQG